jgi:hypothetical protein
VNTKKRVSPTSFLILLLANLYRNWNRNSLTTRDFKVRSLAICVVQVASSSGSKSFIFAICYWWKRLCPKRDLETQIRGLIPSASPRYKDKPHSSTCPLLPNIRVHDQYGTVGLGITTCYHVLSLPGLYTLQLCTLHYVLLLHIHTQSLHYMQIHDGRTIDRAVNGAIATPRLGFLPRPVPGGVYVGRIGTERGYTLCTSVSPANYNSTNGPYSFIRHYEINNGTVNNRNSNDTQPTPTKVQRK